MRADAAQAALVEHYWSGWQRLFLLRPRGRAALPQRVTSRLPALPRPPRASWVYWFQAHALDALVDAHHRTGGPAHRDRARALVAGIRRRNFGRITNSYYDDMGWLALALERGGRLSGLDTRALVATLWQEIQGGWSPEQGALVWRRGDVFTNVPANGPAAILAARLGDLDTARRITDWIHATLVDPVTGAVWDGTRPGQGHERASYTYNYGTVIGADLALHRATRDPGYLERAGSTVRAVTTHLVDPATGLLPDERGGDGGLFKGILARYLAEHAEATGDVATAGLLRRNAEAAWAHRDPGGLFGSDWSRPPQGPVELSVHLSGVLLMEATARSASPEPGSGRPPGSGVAAG